MITKQTILTGATGALAMPACAAIAATERTGFRERIGVGQVTAFVLRSPRVGSAAGWNLVDVPTPVLVRSGGASG